LLYGSDLAHIHASGFTGFATGAVPEIVRRLRCATIPVRSVVDLGCGAGTLSAALVAAGFAVTGIDSSTEFVSLARAAVPDARFIHASIYEAALPPCEAIVAIGEPLTYHEAGADADSLVLGLLARTAELLPPGGRLIFDIIGLGEPSLSGRSWHSGEDWAVLLETAENHVTRTLVRRIETFRRVGSLYRRGHEIHNVRLFDIEDLRRQAAAHGFAVVVSEAYGEYPLPPRRHAFFCTRI